MSKDETGAPHLGGTQRRNPPAGTEPAPSSSASAGTDDGGDRFDIVPVAHRVLTSVVSGTANHIPLYRLYHPSSGDHFYTTSDPERDFAVSVGYRYENVACEVLPVGHPDGVPLYRLFHPTSGDHFYTVGGQLGGLRAGQLAKEHLPKPIGPVKWLFSDNSMSDLFFIVTWGKAA